MSTGTLNNRLVKAKSNIANNINKPKTGILDKLSDFTSGFKKYFKNTNSASATNSRGTNINTNKASVTIAGESPFDNPYLIYILIAITLFFIGYGLYYHYKETDKILNGQSYYGEDSQAFTRLFTETFPTIDDCVKRCQDNRQCRGITYNNDTGECIGVTKGIMRAEGQHLTAWKKGTGAENITDSSDNINTAILLGFASGYNRINSTKVPILTSPYEFNWSFFLYIDDSYHNHGNWRHIMHRGTDLEHGSPTTINNIDTIQWEDIIDMVPVQNIGVWYAPFNNNMRIAITTMDTETKKHKLEYVDLAHVPVKKMIHISVNFSNKYMEIFKDGLAHKTYILSGLPVIVQDANIYIMKEKTVSGSIYDLRLCDGFLSAGKMKEFATIIPAS